MFYGLVWAILAVSGIVIGWTLRANFPEKDVRQHLARTEQERNTLARLYTHLKHQHDLREADFRRTSLEATNLRDRFRSIEMEKAALAAAQQAAANRMERAEATTLQYGEKVAALEQLSSALQAKNAQLNTQLAKVLEELNAWKTLYRDFQVMQQKLANFERASRSLESERDQLQLALAAARTDIDTLQTELARQLVLHAKNSPANVRKGGPAAPEHTDDLKIIKGIGVLIEQQLFQLGVFTFAQISRWDDDAVIAQARKLSISPGKIFQEDWVGQARHLAASYHP
ncbi:MAG: hypothetical protein ABIO24_05895 [Saprospiraceae bacterium]